MADLSERLPTVEELRLESETMLNEIRTLCANVKRYADLEDIAIDPKTTPDMWAPYDQEFRLLTTWFNNQRV